MKINLTKFLKGVLILSLSILIAIPLLLISIVLTPVYQIICFKWQRGLNILGEYLLNVSIVISKLINVSCITGLNLCFLNKNSYKFGNPDDTVLYVLAKNSNLSALSLFGRIITFFIRVISKSSLESALNDKLMHDQDCLLRLNEDNYTLN
jgi:hypothetical protein|tara:strand:- start:5690 stop:6142 length:453 start_codon:yes stop_codon:yes gene_type:complete